MKKFVLVAVAIIASMFAQNVMAQAKDDAAKKAERELQMKTRLEMLKSELKLTDAEYVKFEPVYREFRREVSRVADPKPNRVKKEELTNENALLVISARLTNVINTTAVKQKYLPIFAEVIEPVKIAKLYRIDDRIAKEARKVVQYGK